MVMSDGCDGSPEKISGLSVMVIPFSYGRSSFSRCKGRPACLRAAPRRRAVLPLLIALGIFCTLLVSARGEALENIFICVLYGANEVTNPGDPACYGKAKLDFNYQSETLSYDIKVSGITEPTYINIYGGTTTTVSGSGDVTDTNNPALVTLLYTSTKIKSPKYEQYELSGVVSASNEFITAVASSPSDYYLNVFTANYNYGACRCQLSTTDSTVSVSYSDTNPNVWNGNAEDSSSSFGSGALDSGSNGAAGGALDIPQGTTAISVPSGAPVAAATGFPPAMPLIGNPFEGTGQKGRTAGQGSSPPPAVTVSPPPGVAPVQVTYNTANAKAGVRSWRVAAIPLSVVTLALYWSVL